MIADSVIYFSQYAHDDDGSFRQMFEGIAEVMNAEYNIHAWTAVMEGSVYGHVKAFSNNLYDFVEMLVHEAAMGRGRF
jgi:hypothetical protein